MGPQRICALRYVVRAASKILPRALISVCGGLFAGAGRENGNVHRTFSHRLVYSKLPPLRLDASVTSYQVSWVACHYSKGAASGG